MLKNKIRYPSDAISDICNRFKYKQRKNGTALIFSWVSSPLGAPNFPTGPFSPHTLIKKAASTFISRSCLYHTFGILHSVIFYSPFLEKGL